MSQEANRIKIFLQLWLIHYHVIDQAVFVLPGFFVFLLSFLFLHCSLYVLL